MTGLKDRRKFTSQRIADVRERLKDTEKLTVGKACVYATGSYGRGEASPHSDLDVFIAAKTHIDKPVSQLNRLDEICVKADLIRVTDDLGFPPFSGDGRYLQKYTTHDLIGTLGTPQDDYTNTFTARLLLLLESRPLLGTEVHTEIAEEIIEKYWIDYPDHSSDFRPAFLANDILRLWRTLCVNYEAFTQREPRHLRAKRRLQKYKLAHSRLLTCYSAILNLLFLYGRDKTVTPSDALKLFQTTPTERIEHLIDEIGSQSIGETLREILTRYDDFLANTNAAEGDLIGRFERMEFRQVAVDASRDFGDLVFRALEQVGRGNSFYRMIVV